MTIAQLRKRLSLHERVNSRAFFSFKSLRSNEILREDEETTMVKEAVKNFEREERKARSQGSQVASSEGPMDNEDDSDSEQSRRFKIKVQLSPFEIPPNFPSKVRYSECFIELAEL
jgi:hypothetical protein